MKKFIALMLALILSAAALCSCANDTEETAPDGMKKASGDAASYTLYVPEDWLIDIQTAATTAHASVTDASNVSVAAWDMEHTDDTVEAWWEVNLESLNAAFSDFTEISTEACTMGGKDAVDYVYTAKLGSNEYKYRQVAAVWGGSVYVFTYTATPDAFDSHADEVESMLESFKYN